MATLTITSEEMGESIHVICDDDDRGSRYDEAVQLSLIRELYILYIYYLTSVNTFPSFLSLSSSAPILILLTSSLVAFVIFPLLSSRCR